MDEKILIIDDNVDCANALASMLELWGYAAVIADGPFKGLVALQQICPRVIFLDIGMPEMNGYEVAARIRADKSLQQPFLIAFTAWDDAKSLELSAKAGFNRHIVKTSTFEVLLAAIDEATK